MNDVKTCTKCNEAKILGDFPKDPRMADGYRNQCKACRVAARKIYFPPEKVAEYNKKYFATERGKEARSRGNKRWRQGARGKAYGQRDDVREKRNAKMRRYRLNNPEKNAARQAIRSAKTSGILPPASKLPCAMCGGKSRDYHHYLGYAPEHHLDVIPLCQPCHLQLPA